MNHEITVDASMLVKNPLDAAEYASTLAQSGFDGVYTFGWFYEKNI